jgi:competence protein ComEC
MKKIVGFYLVLYCMAIGVHFPFFKYANSYQLSFLDIGQGDSVYIKTPSNCRILIDAGKPNTLSDQLIDILPFNVSVIDLIIITHPDIDHYGGFTNISKKYDFKYALISPFQKESISYQNLLQDLLSQGTELILISDTQFIDFCDLKIQTRSFKEESANDSSIITHIEFPDGNALFSAGDISTEQEFLLLKSSFPTSANIYKASHHGSNTSNSKDLIDKIKPDYIIIQSGLHNSYGHPHINTLKLGVSNQSTILRNDLQGQIDFFFSTHKNQQQQTLELKLEK